MPSHRTPYNDSYPTCERTYAELRVYGDALDPKVIATRLGIEGSSAQKKGEVRKGFHDRERVVRIGGWFLSSEGEIDSKDVRRHLDWLLKLIMPRADALRSLQQQEDLRMNVTCIWWSAHGQGGPTLWPEQMRALSDLNLECSFDLSFYGPEDEDAPGIDDRDARA